MQRFKALVEYDGTDFLGFQRQVESQRTVQGELETALSAICHSFVPISGSGRTDSGVHATGQVVSFEANWKHSIDALLRALNRNLPFDISVLTIEQVPSTFHPRFDARSRSYRYVIYNGRIRPALNRYRCWHVAQPLDIGLMNQAASLLLGEHDFGTFGNPPQGSNTVRTVFASEWHQAESQYIYTIAANAFLYRMVRSIVGSLKCVGDKSWSVEQFEAAFKAAERKQCAALAPAAGLYLESVAYD